MAVLSQSQQSVLTIEQALHWETKNQDSLKFYVSQVLTTRGSDFENAYLHYLNGRLAASDAEATKAFDSAITLAKRVNDFPLAAQATYRIGRLLSADEKFDSAAAMYQHALQLLAITADRSLLDTLRGKAVIYTSLAFISNQTNDYEGAIRYSFQSLRAAENSGFRDLELVSLINLSAAYGELASPDNRLGTREDQHRYKTQSKEYMIQAASLAEEIEDVQRAGRTYGNLGTYYAYENHFDSSEYYLRKAIALGTTIQDFSGLANAHNMLSFIYQHNSEQDSAFIHAKKALHYSKESQSKTLTADIGISLAELSLNRGALSQSKQYLADAISSAKALNLPKIASHAYDLQHQIAMRENKPLLALDYFKKSIQYRDSLATIENFAVIEALQTRYESEKKEQEIVALKQKAEISLLQSTQQRFIYLGSLTVLLILALIGYFYFRSRNLRSIHQRILMEQKLLRSQMNPHFLFNALSSIHSFLLKGNKKEASEYLTTFSQLTRDILDHTSREWVTLDKEIATLQNYIQVQKLRFPTIECHISIDSDLDIENIEFPPLLLQPFVENSIEHGFRDKMEGTIDISIQSTDQKLSIEMKDNGKGLQHTSENHESKAISIAKERLSVLFGKENIELSVSGRKDIMGVLVSIVIPKREYV